mmetsp:Transcript_2216/g.6220  ORF Transcript_2216/g.6220 Transcript_2216/m.6220 type:complete len:465 (+) Transcript_2216:768-2162(+)
MAPRRILSKRPLPLGWGLMVADYCEEEMNASAVLGSLFGSASFSATIIPVPQLLEVIRILAYNFPWKEKLTSFEKGEDPVKYVMDEVGSIYPRVNQVWPDKTSDAALAHFARSGLGAHRVELAPSDNPFGAKFVVRTNELASLEVRPGYARYGGDAYFDESWNALAIIRSEPIAGEAEDEPHRSCRVDDGLGECDWWRPLVDRIYRPADGYRWEYAKFCFRSSVFTLVTFVDHLFVLHMQTSELVTLACRERLSPTHPIRRFLLPFTYGAITINAWARTALCNYRTTTQRAFAFTDRSYARAWAVAPGLVAASGAASGSLFQPLHRVARSPIATDNKIDDVLDEFLARQGPVYGSPGVDTPFYRTARKYHSIVLEWVTSYVEHFYPHGVDPNEDPEIQSFIEQERMRTFTIALATCSCPNSVRCNLPICLSFAPARTFVHLTRCPCGIAMLPPVGGAYVGRVGS